VHTSPCGALLRILRQKRCHVSRTECPKLDQAKANIRLRTPRQAAVTMHSIRSNRVAISATSIPHGCCLPGREVGPAHLKTRTPRQPIATRGQRRAPLGDDALALAARHAERGVHDRAADDQSAHRTADTGQAQRLVARQLLQYGVQHAVWEVQQRRPRLILLGKPSYRLSAPYQRVLRAGAGSSGVSAACVWEVMSVLRAMPSRRLRQPAGGRSGACWSERRGVSAEQHDQGGAVTNTVGRRLLDMWRHGTQHEHRTGRLRIMRHAAARTFSAGRSLLDCVRFRNRSKRMVFYVVTLLSLRIPADDPATVSSWLMCGPHAYSCPFRKDTNWSI